MLAGVGALLQDTRALMDRLQDGSPMPAPQRPHRPANAAAAFPMSTPTANAAWVGSSTTSSTSRHPTQPQARDQPRDGERLSERQRSHEEASSRPTALERDDAGGGRRSRLASKLAWQGSTEGMVLVAALCCAPSSAARSSRSSR